MSKAEYSLPKHELQKFHNYWEKLDPVLSIEDESILRDIQQVVRSAILQAMREGIDEFPVSGTTKRHVLRASEIRDVVQEIIGKTISRPNLYFHLEKLQKHNLVKVVKTIKMGRNKISYYARTAKIFLWSTKSEMLVKNTDTQSKFSERYVRFTQLLNPEISENAIRKTLREILGYSEKLHPIRVEWVRKHHDKIIKAGLEVSDINNLLNELYVLQRQPDHLHELIKLWQVE